MSDYHFDDDEDKEFGETVRLDGIHKEVKRETERRFSEEEEKLQRLVEREKEREYLQRHFDNSKARYEDEDYYSDYDYDSRYDRTLNAERSSRGSDSRRKGGSSRSGGNKSTGGKRRADMPRKASSGRGGKKNNQYRLFIILAIVVGVLVFVGVFALVFSSMNKGEKPAASEPLVSSVAEKTPAEDKGFTALVKNVNAAGEISYFDITNNKSGSIRTDSQTVFTDKTGAKALPSAMKPGDIVDIAKAAQGDHAAKIAYNTEAFSRQGIKDFTIDNAQRTMVLNGETYMYTLDSLFLSNGTTIEANSVSNGDTINAVGIGKTVWFLEVVEYHGTIAFTNKDKIEEGTIKIDAQPEVSLDETETIDVSAGTHTILVKGKDIEDFQRDIFVTPKETVQVDLSTTQAKTSVIIIKANVSDYVLNINGTAAADPSAPQVLPPGEYTIQVTKDGYEPFEQKVTLGSDMLEVPVELKEKIQMCSYTINSRPAGGTVFVDNVSVGVSPVTIQIPYGEHRIQIQADGYEDFSFSAMVGQEIDGCDVILTATEDLEDTMGQGQDEN